MLDVTKLRLPMNWLTFQSECVSDEVALTWRRMANRDQVKHAVPIDADDATVAPVKEFLQRSGDVVSHTKHNARYAWGKDPGAWKR